MRMLVAFVALAGAARADIAPAPVEPMDLYRLEQPLDPQVSPDGRSVLYLRQTRSAMTDRVDTELWRVDAAGGPARLLVGADRAPSSPRWSPDGRTVAFVGRDGARAQVLVIARDDPRVRVISSVSQRPSALAWSPDSRWLAFTSLVERPPVRLFDLPAKPEGATWAPAARLIDAAPFRTDADGQTPPGSRQIFVVPADGSAPARPVTSGPGDWGAQDDSIAFTPDGRAVIASGDPDPRAAWRANQSDLHLIPLEGGPPRRLTGERGSETSPVISPDGTYIAYVGWRDTGGSYQQTDIFVMPLTGGPARNLTAPLDRRSAQPHWRADGRAVFFLYEDHGVNRIGTAPLQTPSPTAATTPRRARAARVRVDALGPVGPIVGNTRLLLPSSSGASYDFAAGVFAYPSVETDRPPVLSLWREGREVKRLDLNAAWRSGKDIGRLEEIWVASAFDGRRIQAWIQYPPGFDPTRRYPLALDIHGGPHIDYGPMFSITHQLYAAAGYVTVFANPRGSVGYGAAFANLIDKAYPGRDHDDLMSVVDAMVARPYIDPDRLYIGGGSGGGVLTAWAIAKTDRFAAAAVKRPVVNWASTALTTDIGPLMMDYWFEAPPWEKPDEYWRRSPLSVVGAVRTPTIIITGEADWRTPVSDSEQYFQALQARGVESMLMRMPEANHGFGRPSQWLSAILATIAWYDRHGAGPDPHTPGSGEDRPVRAASEPSGATR